MDDLQTEPPTPPTKTSEALRGNLQSLETMKKEWEAEKRKLIGEKAVLQDAANRLNVQVRTVREEARKVAESEHAKEKLRTGVQGVRNSDDFHLTDPDTFSGPRQSQESHC
jgi:uncharacterized protein (DUF3084 family)